MQPETPKRLRALIESQWSESSGPSGLPLGPLEADAATSDQIANDELRRELLSDVSL